MSSLDQIRIRDKRHGVFTVDNVILNGYGKVMGATGIALYVTLCRYASNNSQQCYPSLETICEETGMDRHTVVRKIIHLEKLKLISKTCKAGRATVYTLLEPLSDGADKELIITQFHRWSRGTSVEIHTSGEIHTTPVWKSTLERTYRTNLEEKDIAIAISKKKKPFSSIEDVTNEVCKDLAKEKNIRFQDVLDTLEKMRNWLEQNPRKNHYENHKAGLRNWILREIERKNITRLISEPPWTPPAQPPSTSGGSGRALAELRAQMAELTKKRTLGGL